MSLPVAVDCSFYRCSRTGTSGVQHPWPEKEPCVLQEGSPECVWEPSSPVTGAPAVGPRRYG